MLCWRRFSTKERRVRKSISTIHSLGKVQSFLLKKRKLLYQLQHQNTMEVDIVMDSHITYEVFLFRCLNCIISSRLNPFSQQSLQKHLGPSIEKIKRRKEQFQPVLLEVYIKPPDAKNIVKIEEWSFAPTSAIEESIQSVQSGQSSSAKNKNIFGCRLSSKVYKQLQKHQPEFNLVLHKQMVMPLEGDNVFEAPIQYFQFEGFNCTVSLVYNYEFEEFEEEEFHILSPSSPPIKEVSFRKYSGGVQPFHSLTLKTQQISKAKVKQLRQTAGKMKYQSTADQTIQKTLDYLGLT